MFYFRLHETLEQSLGPKVKSVISSTVTLCPSDKPHPLPLKKPSSSQAPSKYSVYYCVHRRSVIWLLFSHCSFQPRNLCLRLCEVKNTCHSNPALVHFIFQNNISSHRTINILCSMSVKLSYINGTEQFPRKACLRHHIPQVPIPGICDVM